MTHPINEIKLREEFFAFCDNDDSGLHTLSKKGTDRISDYWLSKLQDFLSCIPEEAPNNKTCLRYEPEICDLCANRDKNNSFNDCRSQLIENLKKKNLIQ